MTERTATEDDLRAVLLSRAPVDLDASDFRTRLERLMAEGTSNVATGHTGATADSDASEPEHLIADLDLDDSVVAALATPPRRRSTRSRFAFALTAAACVAAIITLVIALLPGHAGREGTRAATPALVKQQLAPGTIIVGTYRGTGSHNITVPQRDVPRYSTYAAYASCTGGGRLFVFGSAAISERGQCRGSGVFGTSGALVRGRVPVDAAANTSWQVTVVIEPESRTNGSVGSPASDELTGPGFGLRHSGRGTRTVTFAGTKGDNKATHYYRMILSCTGDGVTLPGLRFRNPAGHKVAPYTKTCFTGASYEWEGVAVTLPASVRVDAAAATTWTIYFEPLD